MSGSLPTWPNTLPTIRSFRVMLGSTSSPTPIRPPGIAYSKSFFSASSETILVLTGVHLRLSFASLSRIPGLISTSMPTLRTPSRILPPTTPPFRLSIDSPGLLTSKLRMIIIFGGSSKFLTGRGIWQMASRTASMLYFCWAQMGMIGAFLQRVSFMNYWICLQFVLIFWLSLNTMSILFCRIIM